MKPITTWFVLADAHKAKILINRGPGRGLDEDAALSWTARPTVEYSDKPGRGHSSHGPAHTGLVRRDVQELAEAGFAISVANALAALDRDQAFDRLVLVAAPHMLGSLRDALDEQVATKVTAAVGKDLMNIAIIDLPEHLDTVAAL